MPGVITDKERGEVDLLIRAVIERMQKESIVKGKFYQFDKENKELKGLMKERGISLKDMEEFIFKSGLEDDWKENRSVFVGDNGITIIINAVDHLFISSHFLHDPQTSFNSLLLIRQIFEKSLKFLQHSQFGYVTTDPALFGAGISITVKLKLERLYKIEEFIKMLNSMNFDFYSIDEPILNIKHTFKLKHVNEENFITSVYFKIMSLIYFENFLKNHNDDLFEKLKLDEKGEERKIVGAYNSTFESMRFRVALSKKLFSLNKLVKLFNEKPLAANNFFVSDEKQYVAFRTFFKEYYSLSQGYKSLTFKNDINFDAELNLKNSPKIFQIKIEVNRNFKGVPLTPYEKDLREIENQVYDVVKDIKGEYHKLSENGFKKYANRLLIEIDSNEETKAQKITPDFPHRRGILKVKGHKNLCLLINDFDHIQFITSLDKSTDIAPQMKDFYSFIDSIESKAEFLKDWQFGYLSTFPRLSGTGLSIKCFMKLENLPKNEKKLEDICKSYEYYLKGKSGADFNYEFGNRMLIGLTEREIMENFVKFSSEVLAKDN